MAQIRYTPANVEAQLVNQLNAAWSEPGGSSTKGVEYQYDVVDNNVSRYKKWTFAVRIPADWRENVVVLPLHAPPKKKFADLEQRHVIFRLATRPNYTGSRYCKLNLSDPSGKKKKVVVRSNQKDQLPDWFGLFPQGTIRQTATVRPTKGTDSAHLVCVVSKDDCERMIRLYFAMKVWVLEDGIEIE